MTKTKLTRTLMAACSVVALSAVMYGCSSSSDDAPAMVVAPDPTSVDLSGVTPGSMAAPGTYEIAAGEAMDVGDVTFSCAAGGADCTVTVAADGMATYATDGGMVTAANSAAYQARLTMDEQRAAVNTAIGAATTAIGDLTGMSSDEDVAAAQAAIATATAALAAAPALPGGEILALQARIVAAQASLGTKRTVVADYRTHGSQLSAANGAVEAAEMAVAGLTAASSDDDVAAADAAVAAADAAVAAGTMLTASEKAALNGEITLAKLSLTNKKAAVADRMDQDQQDEQRALVSEAIAAATTVIGGLTDMSSDANVDAAQGAIDTAKMALAAATVLPASDVFALQDRIDAAQASLGTKRTQIAGYRTHQMELSAANIAVEAADTAVGGLNVDSTDAEVTEAERLIAAAEAAVAGGAMLTAAEVAGLNADIASAKGSLGTVKMAMDDRDTRNGQLSAANTAVDAAEMAVAGLTAASTDADVTAADNAVAAAAAAIADGSMLTATEKATLNGRIALARVNLATAKTAISGQQTHDDQLAAATGAVEALEMAVTGLTDMSSDAALAAAKTAVTRARAALEATTVVSASDIIALQYRIALAETDLGAAETNIANYREHRSQYTAATTAVNAAKAAVAALTASSTDEEVDGANNRIAAARKALSDGTMLTADELAMLSGDIATAEASLGTVTMVIDDRKEHDQQHTAAMEAVAAARMAVADLTETSTAAQLAAAETAVAAAKAAVGAGTMLTASERAALEGRIALAEVSLGTARMAVNDYTTHQTQHTAAMGAVGNAGDLVAGLTVDSTDAEVAAAEAAIAAAKTAVTAGATLTEDELATLNGDIAAAEMSLGTVVAQIDLRKERDTAVEVARLHGEASGATTAATAAGEAAAGALEDAATYAGMLGATFVGGDSAMAAANAQKVLDANQAAIRSVIDATAAKTRAQTAKTAATALPDGTTGKTALIARLDVAIEAADEQIKAAMEIRDGTGPADLAAHVAMVTGSDDDNPLTAADSGKAVAELVDGAGVTLLSTTATPPAITVPTSLLSVPVMFDDSMGMTWAEIMGESNLEDKVIVSGGSIREVKAVSVAGIAVEGEGIMIIPGASIAASNPKGTQYGDSLSHSATLTGVLFCAGDDCTVEDSKLVGSWYYTIQAANEKTSYVAASGGGYEEETLYGEYGYWLQSILPGVDEIHTYGTSPGNTAGLAYGIDADDDDHRMATYEGSAAGMSVLKTYDPRSSEVDSIASGGFTADVSLTMRFGIVPTLEGTVSDFEGSAVDTSWEVTLAEKALPGNGGFVDGVTNDGDSTSTAADGEWRAQAYGASGERPTGVTGAFDANFVNGKVVGGYATRKQ